MNFLQKIPDGWRTFLYVGYAVTGPILLYTKSKGLTGESELDLWVGLGAATGLTAAANVSRGENTPVE